MQSHTQTCWARICIFTRPQGVCTTPFSSSSPPRSDAMTTFCFTFPAPILTVNPVVQLLRRKKKNSKAGQKGLSPSCSGRIAGEQRPSCGVLTSLCQQVAMGR